MRPDVLSPVEAAVMAALLHVYDRAGRATIREVADAAHRSQSVTFHALQRLEARGLVATSPRGGLRPLVAIGTLA